MEPETLRRIAGRAQTLDERLALAAGGGASRREDPRGVLDPWIKAFCGGDRRAFLRRLSWDGWGESEVAACLAGDPPVGEPLPAWTATLRAALDLCPPVFRELEGEGRVEEEALFAAGKRPPFLEVLVPFLRLGRRRLARRVGEGIADWSPPALAELERKLLGDLAAVAVRALYDRFSAERWRASGGSDRRLPAPWSGQPGSRRLYLAFVGDLLGGGIVDWLAEYSTLARQLGRRLETWIESGGELIERLHRDRRAIEARFSGGAPCGPVRAVRYGLSDRHSGGRQVAAVELASGERLIYKPRPLDLEAAYNAFVEELGARGLDPAPRPLRLLARDGYGWVEQVEPRPAADPGEAGRYYRRAGSLLCIAWVLQADDLHAENVVASEGGPVIVDAETLLQPPVAPGSGRALRDRSPLGTQLLTSPQLDALGRLYDAGGLRGRGGHAAEARRRFWRHPNTDAMSFEERPAQAAPGDNVLYLDGVAQDPADHAGALLDGFAAAYRWLLVHRRELLRRDGPLARFRRCRCRVLLRPSRVYGAVLALLATPRYQRRAVPGCFLADALNRIFAGAAQRPRLWALAGPERRALEGGDVPRFTAPAAGTALTVAGGETLEEASPASGLDAVRETLGRLSEEDLILQLALVETALAASVPATAQPPLHSSQLRDRSLADLARERAVALGAALERRARGGGATGAEEERWRWLLPDDVPAAGGRPSLHLYDGVTGIACFLAALARVTGWMGYRRLALEALVPVRQALAVERTASPLWREGLGGLSGLGGMVYGLVVVGELLEEEDPLGLARRLAAWIDDGRLARERAADLADGVAGAALGLLALFAATREEAVRQRAAACGRRLLSLIEGPAGAAVRPAAGFAHGAAGIGHALVHLHEATGDAPFRRAAAEVFDRLGPRGGAAPEPAGDPEAGGASPGPRPLGWCSGAAGLGLARLSQRRLADGEEVRGAIERAVEAVLGAGLGDFDHLCCGNLGRIELLIEAGPALGEPDLLRRARTLGGAVLGRARSNGRFALDAGLEGGERFDPGLFRGLAGIGYGLLRLAEPERLPSLLTPGTIGPPPVALEGEAPPGAHDPAGAGPGNRLPDRRDRRGGRSRGEERRA